MSDEITLRLIEDGDVSGVLALWEACGLRHDGNDPAHDVAFCRASGHGAILVAVRAGAVVGSVMVGHEGHRGWMYYVAVDPALRRAGLGRTLVRAAERWLSERGVPKAMLLVRETNAVVIGFYEALGYAVQPRTVMARRLTNEPDGGTL